MVVVDNLIKEIKTVSIVEFLNKLNEYKPYLTLHDVCKEKIIDNIQKMNFFMITHLLYALKKPSLIYIEGLKYTINFSSEINLLILESLVIHKYNCIKITDINDEEILSIVRFAQLIDQNIDFYAAKSSIIKRFIIECWYHFTNNTIAVKDDMLTIATGNLLLLFQASGFLYKYYIRYMNTLKNEKFHNHKQNVHLLHDTFKFSDDKLKEIQKLQQEEEDLDISNIIDNFPEHVTVAILSNPNFQLDDNFPKISTCCQYIFNKKLTEEFISFMEEDNYNKNDCTLKLYMIMLTFINVV